MANVKVERKGSYQGVPQWGIRGSSEMTPTKATAEKWAGLENAARRKPARCNQCEALMINGIFCHETGCPNTNARYEDGAWLKQRKCFECGCTVDEDDACCNGLDETDYQEPAEE